MRDSSINVLRAAFLFSRDVANKSIEELEDYRWIVKNPGYKDFTPRTMKGVKKEEIIPALEHLASELFDYIHNPDNEYESWHRQTCDAFCKKYQELSRKSINYGKAQKILNMSMKYLYCFPNAELYMQKFKACHMPLDTYTLTWFCEVVLPKYNDGKRKKERVSKTKILNTSWSNLNYGIDENDKYSYLWIQKQIKDYLASSENTVYVNSAGRKLTPFEAEFYIWPEQQFIQAYKQIINQGIYDGVYPRFQDNMILKMCNHIIERVTEFKQNKLL